MKVTFTLLSSLMVFFACSPSMNTKEIAKSFETLEENDLVSVRILCENADPWDIFYPIEYWIEAPKKAVESAVIFVQKSAQSHQEEMSRESTIYLYDCRVVFIEKLKNYTFGEPTITGPQCPRPQIRGCLMYAWDTAQYGIE